MWKNPYFWLGSLVAMLALSVVAYFLFSASGDPAASVYRVQTGYIAANGKEYSFGMGTGFLVGSDIIVTNHHVVSEEVHNGTGSETVIANKIKVFFLDNGELKSRGARVLWNDPDQDLAILKALGTLPGRPIVLADITEAQLAKGAQVTAIGFPGVADRLFGSDTEKLDDETTARVLSDPTVTTGTVQRIVPTLDRLVIQHGATIEGGNSGGPLLDACSRVVGVNTFGHRNYVDVAEIKKEYKKKNPGRVDIVAPRALNGSVHVQEVIKALRHEGLVPSTSSSTCRAGLTGTGQFTIGTTLILALAAMSLALFTFLRKPAVISETYTQYQRRQAGGSGGGTVAAAAALGADATRRDAAGATRSQGLAVALSPLSGGERLDLSAYAAKLSAGGVVVGRSAGAADVVIPDDSISRSHARIASSAGGLTVTDLGSTNGVLVNGQKLAANQSAPLAKGDRLKFGQLEYMVEVNEKAAAVGTGDQWMLSGFDRKGAVIQQTIDAPVGRQVGNTMTVVATIGRIGRNTVIIDDESISREHASIAYMPGSGLSIRDLGSTNGTFVDGNRIGQEYVSLAAAQKLRIGEVELSLSKTRGA